MKKILVYSFFAVLLLIASSLTSTGQTITTYAGGGTLLGDGGPATAAHIYDAIGGAFDASGNYYFADGNNSYRIRKISTAGIITTVAGNGIAAAGTDGVAATATTFIFPNAVKLDSLGNLYIVDGGNNKVRKVDAITGIISTIAGTGAGVFGGDGGPATAATLYNPQDVCIDRRGNLYIADYWTNRVRKVDPSGIITTFAGGGTSGLGDDGPATAAQLINPSGVAIDDTGNLYIADFNSSTLSNRVRKVDTFGIITTVAGNGNPTYSGDGILATDASINPIKIGFDDSDQLYIADENNYRVLKVDRFGIIHSVAGNGSPGYSGDGGPATAAEFNYPSGIAFDVCGNLYIPEPGGSPLGHNIRKVTYPPILTIPTITLSGVPAAYVGALVTVTATVTNAGSSYNIEWYNHGVQFSTTTVPSVTYTKGPGIDTITARVVSTATYGCYDSATSADHTVMVAEGVKTLTPNTELYIYPNPVNDVLHIDGVGSSVMVSSSNQESYKILSMVGTVLQHGTLQQGSNTIPMQSLPAGLYMVEVNGSEGEKTMKKIIKQ